MDWSALVVGVIGLAGVWLGGFMQSSFSARQSRVDAIQDHNNRAATALADLLLTTDKLRPDSFIWEREPGESVDRFQELIEELRVQQPALTTISVGHPVKEVRDGMGVVLKQSFAVLKSVADFVATFSRKEGDERAPALDSSEKRDKAKTDWNALREGIDEVVSNMHTATQHEPAPKLFFWRQS